MHLLILIKGGKQTAGISKTPEAYRMLKAFRNWYGNGLHAVAYPISETHISWAITQRESTETTETWRPYLEEELPQQRNQLCNLLHGWSPDVLEMVNLSERIIKFGLFDRVELQPKQWYSKRCVLVGDAAHPTSPHLGQGANQAL
jgi:salicylate hydroxylase